MPDVNEISKFIDAEGDLLGDNESSILDPNEVMDMESIIRDQQLEIVKEKQKADLMYQRVQDTKNN